MKRTAYDRCVRPALLAGSAALLLAFSAGCAETPQSAYEQIIKHGDAGQFDKVWDRIDKTSQGRIEGVMHLAAFGLGMKAGISGNKQEAEQLRNLAGKDLFVKICQEMPKAREDYAKRRVKSVKTEGDRATLTVVATGGGDKEETVHMIKEDGIWKLSIGG